MKIQAGVCFVLSCSLALSAADAALGAEALNRWVGGQWVSNGQFVDSAYSKANKASATTKCAWSAYHTFVICDQDIDFGGTPMHELSVYTYAAKTGKFYFYGISLGEEEPRHTALDISDNGNRWTYSSSEKIKGQPVEFRSLNEFHGNNAVEWWSEYSTDGGKTWTKTGQGSETRRK